VSARRRVRQIAEIGGALVAVATLLVWCSIPRVGYLADDDPATTSFIEIRRRAAADAGRPWKLEQRWVPLGKISPYLRAAVVYSEDIHFWTHDGVDWSAIEAAAESGGSRGGSTITQQVAKNLYLSPSRSLVRKLRELLITYRLEDALDKHRILELYLNIAEWGDGVFGAEAAARHWFHRSAAALTPAQAARLAVALPNPRTRSPQVHAGDLVRKCDRLLRWMRKDHVIGPAQYDEARVELGLARAPEPPASATTTTTEPPLPEPDHDEHDDSDDEPVSSPATAP
jgi:monofunctional biosynthetic peptidoglycan transglycosylase